MNTDKKNQHFIPKFYLKHFSYKKNEKQIGIFNVENKFFHPTSKLKTQGSKNFFYGTDGIIENNLSNIEGKLASAIRNLINTQKLPKKLSNDHIEMLVFVSLTHLRNPTIINFMNDSREEMRKALLRLDPNSDTKKIVPVIDHDVMIKVALSGLKEGLVHLSDLDYKLLINKTNIPFISSDFPVVKYNRFLEEKKWPHGKTGYANTGLQIFIPINPTITIVLFDSMIYKVGNKKDTCWELNHQKDIDQLNLLQILNCLNTVFFNENISKNYIEKLFEKLLKYNRANKVNLELSYLINDGEDDQSYLSKEKNLMNVGTTDCEIKLDITGIKIHSNSKKIKLSKSMVQLRPKALEELKKRSRNRH